MPCYSPLYGYRSFKENQNGKYPVRVVGSMKPTTKDHPGELMQLPCGQCIGCRLERSRQWAVRCVHEASLYDENCFITLTYNNEKLPTDNSLKKSHFQKFMKRLRKQFPNNKIRYYMCGEYGEQLNRPHYHACLFNFDFPDKEFWSEREGIILYRSEILEKIWTTDYSGGFCTVGDVTFESAAYCARYVMKKITGKEANEHYQWVCEVTGEIFEIQPEFTTMSRRPGIGKGWIDEYGNEVIKNDSVISRGREVKPPRYYDQLFENTHPTELEFNRQQRKTKQEKQKQDRTPSRLRDKRQVKLAQLGFLKRKL